jgi:hypothetical protein
VCGVASKVFSNALQKIALYGYCMSTMSKVMYNVLRLFGFLKDTCSVITPTGSILFPSKRYRGIVDSFSCLLA